jgi:hypothetical protein
MVMKLKPTMRSATPLKTGAKSRPAPQVSLTPTSAAQIRAKANRILGK